jgi:hypothetical protein
MMPILAPRKKDKEISLSTCFWGGYVLLTRYIEKIIFLSSAIFIILFVFNTKHPVQLSKSAFDLSKILLFY